jgi:hypothetical protein
VFDLEAVQDHHGDAQLDIYEDEEASAKHGNATVKREAADGTVDAAEAVADAFLDFCEAGA